MKPRIFFIFFMVSAILLSIQWTSGESSRGSGTTMEMMKKKKRKKRKKKKDTKKKKDKKSKKSPRKKSAKQERKDSTRSAKRVDRNLDRIAKEKEKKQKAVAKQQKKRNDYDKCDSTDIVRTSNDTNILVKYIKVYHSLGGTCYILHLQKMAKLEKTGEGQYTVRMRPSSDPRAPADWQTYLFCPIGKPDGMIALCSPEGDTVQVASYAGEKKNGLMSWFKKGEGIIHQERYVNDEKVWVMKEE